MAQVKAVVKAKEKLYIQSVHTFDSLNCARQLEMTQN
jgi:hypothetical protein